MTFAPPDVSRVGARRIGVANAVLWIAGSIVLVVVGATAAYSFVVAPYTGGGLLGGDEYPWEADQPLVATEADGVWSADASGVIRIPAAQFTEALEATMVGGGEVMLYRTNPALGPTYTDDYFYPEYIGYIYGGDGEVILPAGDDDLELWVGTDGAWQLRLAPIEATMMDDDGLSGTGNAYIVYTGDAVSARFIHVGEGLFYVTVYTAYAQDYPINAIDDVDQRISWDPDSYVLFEIESTGGSAWTIDIDELAQSTPAPTPTPTPTPSPTETP